MRYVVCWTSLFESKEERKKKKCFEKEIKNISPELRVSETPSPTCHIPQTQPGWVGSHRAAQGAGSQQHAHPACPRHLRAAWAPCDGTTPMCSWRLDHAPERHRRRHGARGVGMAEKGSLLNRRALSISVVAVQTTWPPCDGATPRSRRRLDGALSSSLLGEGSRLGCGEGGVVAASQRGVYLRDSLGVHAPPRRLVNGARPG